MTTETDSRPRAAKGPIRNAMDHPLFTYRLVIATVGVLVFIGLLMVISSSQVIGAVQMDDPYYFGKRQIFFAGLGLIGGLGLSMLPENAVRGLARPALLLGIVLLVLTLTPLGVQIAGNRNWLAFGADWTQFQPSEFAKVALIVWGADDLSRRRKQLTDLRQWLPYVGITFTLVGLVVFQKDQGTAMIMAAIVMLIMVAAGAPWRLLAVIAAGVAGLGALMVALQPNRMGRIWAFLNPDLDPLGLNMQARRGIYALASGGWFGQGLGASRQKWGLLSEAHTDYIFAIIGEELGAVGALTVIALFAVLAFAGIRIARRSTSVFSRLIAIGVVTWFSVQAFANIAVAVRLFPVMGVTLPMVSYGGSSLMANLFAAGLLAGCARREPQAVKHLASRKRKPRARTIVRTH